MDADDPLDHLSNLCADLVSLRRLEPGLVHLFRERPPGTWVPVADLYALAGADPNEIPAGLSAAWLPAGSGSGVVSFFDDEQMWSMSAVYNVHRLLTAHPLTAVA
ncbi:MAG: hypothetical protein MUF18_19050 [Fimbriiglobus sp.]|jgi:hypothetical protein|nr:hypothetical protein [Fimbriiglobus sp.]